MAKTIIDDLAEAMQMTNSQRYGLYGGIYGGLGFIGFLTIVFIVLKLLEVINWSWIWVLSPIWIPAAIIFLFCAIAMNVE